MSIAIHAAQTSLSGVHQSGQANSVDSTQQGKETTSSSKSETPRLDEYVHSKEQEDAAGIYSLSKDEEGNPKIDFDNPEEQMDKTAPDEVKDPASKEEPQETKCTVDTGKVDAEIKKLKEKQQNIQQKLSQLPADSDKRAELEKQLANVEMEISTKDNDAYRKQNASYTNSDAS